MLDINLERETEDAAIYIHTSRPGVSQTSGPHHEKHIDTKYLDGSNVQKSFRLETYRSLGTVSSANLTQLRCYFIAKCDFVVPNPTEEQKTDILLTSDKTFITKASAHTLKAYENIIKQVLQRTGPVIEMVQMIFWKIIFNDYIVRSRRIAREAHCYWVPSAKYAEFLFCHVGFVPLL